LTELTVEDFRGFSAKEEFKFQKRITLVYGPNGTGKSSFCEALEYSMLGYIVEAEAKRIELTRYIRNSFTGRSSKPILKAKENAGAVIQLAPSIPDYYFCFVEKNRIEDFAKISSYTPNDQQNLLSQLFGLLEFNRFVDEFTDNIENYVDIKGKKAEELKTKQQLIEKDKLIVGEYGKKLNELDEEKGRITADTQKGATFEDLDLFLHGSKENEGRISELDKELQNPILHISSFVDSEGLLVETGKLKELLKRYSEKNRQFNLLKDKVVFRQLFQAVKELKNVVPDRCPVCETSIKGGFLGLNKTRKHPYLNADKRLKELEEVAILEKERDDLWSETCSAVELIKDALAKRFDLAAANGIPKDPLLDFPSYNIKLQDERFIDGCSQSILALENVVIQLKIFDLQANKRNDFAKDQDTYRSNITKEKELLSVIARRMLDLKNKQAIYTSTKSGSEITIEEFNKINKSLIEEVQRESSQLQVNRQFVIAYKSLKSQLGKYKNDLPAQLIVGLNDLTKELYNKINHHDAPAELIDKLELPLTSEQPIKVWFQDDPTKEYNALQLLSEGHIRCLGLSILLGKVIQEGRKIIIFDDIVNAIDDDHRGGVRELIFSDVRFKDCQIIMTTHAEQFIKDLDNNFSMSEYEGLVERITFRSPEDRQFQVEHTSMNYLKRAKEALDLGEKKECLTWCRKSLENVSLHLWDKLDRKYQATLSVKKKNSKAPIELMSLVSSLRSFITKTDALKFQKVIELFGFFEGLDTKNKNIWSYLNKGVHEELDQTEFDVLIVTQILESMIALDSEVKK
jgi:AAA15 family ATPase/GTPase